MAGPSDRVVAHAPQLRPQGLTLATFPARRFYGRHGFVAGAVSEGLNEEREPGVRYSWRPIS